MIDVVCNHSSTFNRTLPTQRSLGEPEPSDRLPNWSFAPRSPGRVRSGRVVLPRTKINCEGGVV